MRLMFMKFRQLAFIPRLTATILAIGAGFSTFPATAADPAKPDPTPSKSANQTDTDLAEQAWKELLKSLRPPPPPASWRTNSPTRAELDDFNKRNGELAAQVADQARDFYTRFPGYPKADDARKKEMEMRRVAVQLGNVKQVAQLSELEDVRLNDRQGDPDERLSLRWRSIQRAAMKSGPEGSPAFFDKLQEGIIALSKEFPDRPEMFGLMMQMLQIRTQIADADQARAFIRAILESKAPEELKEMARMLAKRFDLQGKPMQIKFTAADGRVVDLDKMRGKVVLLDFWASWCPPCMAEVPHLKSTYEKFHPKGFEIIGINSDDEKEQMEHVLDVAKISWPQYFDGQGQTNKFAAEFGVITLPTMWLVDKQGTLRDLNARMNLEEKVEKLLSEQPALK